MKKFVQAIIIGYAVMWLANSLKGFFGNREINSLEDIKQILRERL
jgi:cytosine/uracil/thiamine/allantoin permease